MNENIWAPIWVTQDMCIWEGKLLISCITITASATACSVTFRNGRDVTANIIATIDCLANRSQHVCLPQPVYLENGLYVELDANTVGVFIVYRPISEITE